MQEKIKNQILERVESILDEIDIDKMIAEVTSSKEIKKAVEAKVEDLIAGHVHNRLMQSLRKRNVILDTWSADIIKKVFDKMGIKH